MKNPESTQRRSKSAARKDKKAESPVEAEKPAEAEKHTRGGRRRAPGGGGGGGMFEVNVSAGGLLEVCWRSAGGLPEVGRKCAKKKSNIHTLWARSAQPLFSVKFISCTRPLINWRGCGQTGTLCQPLYILCNTNLVIW